MSTDEIKKDEIKKLVDERLSPFTLVSYEVKFKAS